MIEKLLKKSLLTIGLCFFAVIAILAQNPTDPETLEKILVALASRADSFEKSLPDFIATETILQESYQKPSGKLLESSEIVSRLTGRQLELTKKGRTQLDFQEYRQVQSINGKTVKSDKFKPRGPQVDGVFSSILVSHFASRDQKDFSFDLDTNFHILRGRNTYLLKFTSKIVNQQYYFFEGKRLASEQVGQAWIDTETLVPLRIEYQEKKLPKGLESLSYAVDYAYVTLGEDSFLLPIEASSEFVEKKFTNRVNQKYSDYKKFSTDVKLE
ncbi:MAG: hypothetical protein JNM06_16750 [Blastocatellia bacterium]|nr:hypothetical protein [Blastocatellia bacterium]